jgi:hypothetical protein
MPDNDIEQRIRERAFYIWIEQGQPEGNIWIEQGQPEGKDREHWEQAESELTAGVAAPQGQIEFARGQPAQHESASSGDAPSGAATHEPAGIESAAAMPGIDAIGQIKYAAAREVDQGGTDPALQPSQSAQSWRSYQSAAQSWDHYNQRCGGH